MLKERVLALAEIIANPKNRYSMANPDWCIAGWAQRLSVKGHLLLKFDGSAVPAILGLSDQETWDLCGPPGWMKYRNPLYTRERTVAVLKHLADTGIVDWEAPHGQM